MLATRYKHLWTMQHPCSYAEHSAMRGPSMGPQSHGPLQNKKIAFTQPLCNYCAVYAQV
jgi:hypothetical protein